MDPEAGDLQALRTLIADLTRRVYHLEEYIRMEHFDKMGKLLVVTTLTLAYLYFADQLTVWYAKIPAEEKEAMELKLAREVVGKL